MLLTLMNQEHGDTLVNNIWIILARGDIKKGGIIMAYSEECCHCIHAERDPGSSSGWYCNWKRTHVDPDESCYKYEAKY